MRRISIKLSGEPEKVFNRLEKKFDAVYGSAQTQRIIIEAIKSFEAGFNVYIEEKVRNLNKMLLEKVNDEVEVLEEEEIEE